MRVAHYFNYSSPIKASRTGNLVISCLLLFSVRLWKTETDLSRVIE
jgi:hypothetical protein